ncbi:unnamed protein product [Cuscuta epithymum]|uniref:Uncharacterized protein n=1 Tax=Cuscuta epithymum TaxID=186058 RepID=A0AAV0EC27_9ASTE|nr:unnamed protein product [Cuscuta epithymum]
MSASLNRSLELKRMLSHMKKKPNVTMEQYVWEIKTIASSLASINSPVSNKELIQTTLLGLGRAYESLITNISLFPGQLTFDDLGTILVEQESRLEYLYSQEADFGQPAFAASSTSGGPQSGRGNFSGQQRGRGGRGPCGGRGRGGRDRG